LRIFTYKKHTICSKTKQNGGTMLGKKNEHFTKQGKEIINIKTNIIETG